ncbi:MAG: hypothetical protein JWN33_504 [Candidatus Saccharibacteria bacterium]|nr:hypothetical protein [Candidatus Saccharibacteria bacterium]
MLTALSAFSGFSVDSIDKARTFYVDTLVMKPLDDNMGLMLELPGGNRLFVYEKADHQPASFTVLNFVVENIDETVDHLSSHGISFERYDNLPAPQGDNGVLRGKDAGMGPNIAWFKDPAGNILAVIEN